MQLKNKAAGGNRRQGWGTTFSTEGNFSVQENPTNVNPTATRVEVLDFRTVTERYVRAACRVRVGAVLIDGVRKVGDAWQPVVTLLSPSLEATINRAVMAAWREVGR